jgi:hypothetical protein
MSSCSAPTGLAVADVCSIVRYLDLVSAVFGCRTAAVPARMSFREADRVLLSFVALSLLTMSLLQDLAWPCMPPTRSKETVSDGLALTMKLSL